MDSKPLPDSDKPSKEELVNIDNILANSDPKIPKPRKKGKPTTLSERKKYADNIIRSVDEFMDCYIIVGFDIHGNSISLIHSQSELEYRGLADALGDFVDQTGILGDESDF
jgi:hypothetical protein